MEHSLHSSHSKLQGIKIFRVAQNSRECGDFCIYCLILGWILGMYWHIFQVSLKPSNVFHAEIYSSCSIFGRGPVLSSMYVLGSHEILDYFVYRYPFQFLSYGIRFPAMLMFWISKCRKCISLSTSLPFPRKWAFITLASTVVFLFLSSVEG